MSEPAEIVTKLPKFTADDVPLWLEEKLGADLPRYVALRNDMVKQVQREAKLAGGWSELARGYLRTIGDNAPPFGGLHHTLNIIAAALKSQETTHAD